MKVVKYNKLVRNEIVNKILVSEIKTVEDVKFHIAKGKELENSVIKKVREEFTELLKAKNYEERVEELVDVCEILTTYMEVFKIDVKDVDAMNAKKLADRGDFSKHVILESVTYKGKE